ncbi:helix-turn-helix domain-containing protein [bacterium]|nr:helix-turn-helix domain-containing protein [bacterium]
MNIEIANRLQKLRKENGYSQEELADKLGISRQAVSKWERAESSPDTDNLIVLARLYDMSLDELLYDNESNEEIRRRTLDKSEEESIKLSDDEGQAIEIKNKNVRFINKDGTEEPLNKKRTIILSVIDGVITILTLIAYLIWSFMFDKWYVSWVLWILMPVIMSIFEAIFKKRVTKFLYPVLVTAVFCYLGMEYSLWHPMWILFISIPIFYTIADPIDKYVLKTKELDEDD